ncbi:hypothetical protein HIM_00867 [Hirsutella minnesotensis 3608]|nr:hypothetical protein HIM_00867 [Hirsutella minnesotensis 3608]
MEHLVYPAATPATLAPAPFPATSQAAIPSGWYNLTAWAVNVTRYAPLFEEIVWAGPRIFMKLGSYMASPGPLDAEPHQRTSMTAESDLLQSLGTGSDLYSILQSKASHAISPTSSPAVLAGDAHVQTSRFSIEGARGLGSVFSYATSKWALSCVAMAIILNRTHIFAATRRRLRLRWHIRMLLRLAPVLLLAVQACRLLQSIQCQTSPDFVRLRWGETKRAADMVPSHPNAWLNTISSFLLMGATDAQSCMAVGTMHDSNLHDTQSERGSLSHLWPLFGTFCLSHFLETVSCAVQGRSPASETGMTLFEQSLAFAEADAAVSDQLGWTALANASRLQNDSNSTLGSTIAMTRSMALKRVNAAPEVLLVAFLSSMTHITSHILGIFDAQSRFRLFSTGFWAICFMLSIVWSALSFEPENPLALGLLRFPTVCIIGFVPHVLVLTGILVCLGIYAFALFLSALVSPHEDGLPLPTFRQRLAYAHANMQATNSLSDIRITREMDFYTALLRTGFAAITLASEAVYLNEDRGVTLQHHTWLEAARLREIEELQRQCIGMGLPSLGPDQADIIGLVPIKADSSPSSNGYARERAAQNLPKGRGERGLRLGTGATERSSRWYMAIEFLLTTAKLVIRVCALSFLWSLGVLRVAYRPRWLLRLARRPKPEDGCDDGGRLSGSSGAERSVAGQQDDVPSGAAGIDVEAEFRNLGGFDDEESLDLDLYKYWLKGGWWGSDDSSGDFNPDSTNDDWDNTSVVSATSALGRSEDEGSDWESEYEGQKTPTAQSQRPAQEDLSFDDSSMALSDLARLLHPGSREEREEALRLAAHLQSEKIMTRAAFRRMETIRRARVLTTLSRGEFNRTLPNAKLTPEEEERLLEHILISRRQASGDPGSQSRGHDWAFGEGSPCVVCQSSSRTIIVWPCRCLSLCDDCRVSLAMNNFDKCVCCRRDVLSFSRIFVP